MINNQVVLVGVDFSGTAANALDEARRLAERMHLRVELLHVLEGFRREPSWTPTPSDVAWLRGAGLTPDAVVVRSGTPWLEIVRYAEDRPADLVVIGTHGRTGFQPISLGGTASRLAILSPRPVVLVSPKAKNGASVID